MDALIQVAVSFAAGVVLGLVFFGGLWATLNGLGEAPRPGLRILASLVARFGIVLAGLSLLGVYGGWQHLLAALLGLVVMRRLLVRRLSPAPTRQESGPCP